MFTVTGMRKLHNWTDSSLTLLLDHLSTIPEGDYVKEISGFGFPTLQAQVMHIFNCEGFWIHMLQGIPFKDEEPGNWPSVPDAKLLQGRVNANTFAYFSGLTDQQLNADTELHFSDGDKAVCTPALVLHHVFTHAFHHKGQIVSMCRILGHPAPDTDLHRFA